MKDETNEVWRNHLGRSICRRHPADADEEKHPKRASGMEPGKMSDLRTGMLETNVKTGDPAEENASSLHRVRTQNRK